MGMPLFRVLKARKAKHGYQAGIGVKNFIELAEAKKMIEGLDPEVKIELNFNMGANEFKVYTDNDEVAALFEAQFC